MFHDLFTFSVDVYYFVLGIYRSIKSKVQSFISLIQMIMAMNTKWTSHVLFLFLKLSKSEYEHVVVKYSSNNTYTAQSYAELFRFKPMDLD